MSRYRSVITAIEHAPYPAPYPFWLISRSQEARARGPFLLPVMLQSGDKRFKLFLGIILSFVLLATLTLWHNDGLGTLRDKLDRQFCSMNANYDEFGTLSYGPQVRKNIAIASSFGAHHDVFLALAWTVERVMKNRTLTVYAPLPYGHGFQDIVDELGLFHGITKNYDELIRDVLANPGAEGIDIIILGTCEVECVAFKPFFGLSFWIFFC